MGINQSYPIPKDEDFYKSSVRPTNTLDNTMALRNVRFSLPKKVWDKKTNTPLDIGAMGIQIEVNSERNHCIIRHDGNIVGVLRQSSKADALQICSPSPPVPEATAVDTLPEGPVYVYATVTKVRNNARQYILKMNGGNQEAVTWRTEMCGSVAGPKDWIIHALPADGTAPDKRNPNLVAYVRQEPKRTWGCRVAEGADPLLALCMILCHDRFRVLDEVFLRRTGGNAMHSSGGWVTPVT